MNRQPSTIVIIAWVLWTTTSLSYATLPVVDYSHIAQDAGNEVVNLAKWAKTEVDAAQTQLNTLNTYENTVLQVARLGNPAALRNLPGISTVTEMYQVYGKLSQNYATVQRLLNPQRYQNDLNYILGAYQLPKWDGFNTASGLPVLPAQGLFQFSTGSWNVANNAQQQLTALDQQRQKLQQQRDRALSSLEAATTVSEVQKYHAVLDSLNAAIAEVSQGEQELYHRTALEDQQVQAGQQIYNASQAELNRAAEMTGFDRELLSIPISTGGQ
jgi:flagellar biosynthesis chaperone FliJ